MQEESTTIPRAVDLMFIAHNLERIADHATNIAEDVLFLVKGIDVRHHAEVREQISMPSHVEPAPPTVTILVWNPSPTITIPIA